MKQEEKTEEGNSGNRLFRDVALISSIITGYIFVVSYSAYHVYETLYNGTACGCVVPVPVLIIILSSLGVFVGSMLFWLLSQRFLSKSRERKGLEKKTLQFLPTDERTIVQELIRSKGELRQSAFEKKTGLDRVKVHRVLKRLLDKGLIESEIQGNSKSIRLKEGFRELFV